MAGLRKSPDGLGRGGVEMLGSLGQHRVEKLCLGEKGGLARKDRMLLLVPTYPQWQVRSTILQRSSLPSLLGKYLTSTVGLVLGLYTYARGLEA